jgi:hypothetical protein
MIFYKCVMLEKETNFVAEKFATILVENILDGNRKKTEQ